MTDLSKDHARDLIVQEFRNIQMIEPSPKVRPPIRWICYVDGDSSSFCFYVIRGSLPLTRTGLSVNLYAEFRFIRSDFDKDTSAEQERDLMWAIKRTEGILYRKLCENIEVATQ